MSECVKVCSGWECVIVCGVGFRPELTVMSIVIPIIDCIWQ